MILFVCAVAALLLLLVAGLPIAFSLAVVGVAGFALARGPEAAIIMIGQVGLDSATNYGFSVLPLFILMGNIIGRTRLARDLYAAAYAFLGHRRGGLAMATIGASGGFAAISGSSYACAATMTGISVPAMREYNYEPGFAAASVAVGGTLGVLIPPSVGMVFYSLLTGVSLGKLMIAGILPGLLTIALYLMVISIVTRWRPSWGPIGRGSDWRGRLRSLAGVWPILLLFTLIVGGIYFGILTAMEAAGVGAAGALALSLLRRQITLRTLREAITSTVITTVNLFLVFFGALLFANLVTIAGVPQALLQAISNSGLSGLEMLAITVAVFLALGCILESTSLLLLTLPIFFPVLTGLGYDPVWFGIFVIVVAEIGLITPPIGMNVFVVGSMLPDIPVQRIFRGLLPFLAADLLRLALLILLPGIALLLPGLMG
ncbi:MAG: TRAP transporter large permease [Gammaproteobacteria bacterium]|nr:TRAP transporter large permease [Gammaproteobacteria bacterium]